MRRTRLLTTLLPLAALAAALAPACADPVHDAEVSALGPETPGVPPGPTHRPGQPCLTCHGGDGPANATFVTAGTIYQSGYSVTAGTAYLPLVAGVVHLIDSTGATYEALTNAVGNFYVTPGAWNPTFPLGDRPVDGGQLDYISVYPAGMPTQGSSMQSHIARGGVYASCSYCHFDPPGPTSPGHVYLNPAM